MCDSGPKPKGLKIIFPSPLTAVHITSELRSHGPEVEGRDLGFL